MTVARLQLEEQALLQAQGIWTLLRDSIWRDLLNDHPLAGDAKFLRLTMKAMVIEGDEANRGKLDLAYSDMQDARAFVEAIGGDWDPVTSKHGMWAVRPCDDAVVLLAPGYLATDAEDFSAISTMMRAAALLPFKVPLVVTLTSLKKVVEQAVQAVGSDWPVRTIRSTGKDLKIGP